MSNTQSLLDRSGVVAYRLAPKKDCVDIYGRDQDDYRSIMYLHVTEKLTRIDGDLSDGEVGRQKWVTTLLQRKRLDCYRQLTRADKLFCRLSDLPALEAVNGNVEAQLVQRDLLRKLHAMLAASDWSMLMSLIEHRTVREAWIASGQTITEGAFRRHMRRACKTAKKIIQKITR